MWAGRCTISCCLLFVVLCCCCCCCCAVGQLVVVLPARAPCVSRPHPLSVASCCCWRVSFWATRAFVASFVRNELASLLCAHTSPGGRDTEPRLTARRANQGLRCLQAPVGKMETGHSALFLYSCLFGLYVSFLVAVLMNDILLSSAQWPASLYLCLFVCFFINSALCVHPTWFICTEDSMVNVFHQMKQIFLYDCWYKSEWFTGLIVSIYSVLVLMYKYFKRWHTFPLC